MLFQAECLNAVGGWLLRGHYAIVRVDDKVLWMVARMSLRSWRLDVAML